VVKGEISHVIDVGVRGPVAVRCGRWHSGRYGSRRGCGRSRGLGRDSWDKGGRE
jgi:hypothetical protein